VIQGLLAGRRAIVTGGGSGIGRAIAERFAEAGARVAVLDTDETSATEVVASLSTKAGNGNAGIPGLALVADVGDADAVRRAFWQAADAFGGLDIVVNNAGAGSVKALHRYSDDEWERLVRVNLTGVFHGIRAAVDLLRAAGGGSIVNVASLSGIRPTRGEGPYSAAKAGVIALTATAALEYGPDIRVNCVSPGVIETPLTHPLLRDPAVRERIERRIPLKRAGTAAEVANVVAFLASDLAAYVTGTNLVVDGGSILPSAQTDDLLARFVETAD
jgi:NAD(P)-dependent dehydrogenase (short-subunit alcohol dehydrogenase family)